MVQLSGYVLLNISWLYHDNIMILATFVADREIPWYLKAPLHAWLAISYRVETRRSLRSNLIVYSWNHKGKKWESMRFI